MRIDLLDVMDRTAGSRARAAALLALALLGCSRLDPADLVLLHARIYPFAVDSGRVEAMAIRDGRIVYIGTDARAEAYRGSETRVIDLGGRPVLPGFHDTHVHPRGGIALAECPLATLATRSAILDSVRRCATSRPDRPWIRGSGWELPVFPAANPHKEWLDSVVPDRPVYLRAADGHSAWVNSRALEIAMVTASTSDPANGRIERDAAGNPTGTLRESAMELVTRHLPPRSPEDIRDGLAHGLALANQVGITTVHEASADTTLLAAYAELADADRLTARVVAAMAVDPLGGIQQVATLRAWRDRFARPPLFRPTAAKLFVDGVIEAKTAVLLAPYGDGSGSRGTPTLPQASLDSLVAALDAAGFQVHAHAIGDGAVRMMLDALEHARRLNGPRDARPILAHLQLIHPDDLPRFERLGVVASFQPLWAWADTYILDLTIPVLDSARSNRLYPMGSMARAGAHLAAGSDWPVSSINPFEAIQVAISRRAPNDTTGGPAWLPEERVDLPTMLRAYTVTGAWAAGDEASNGTLEVGKAADLIVLDRDPHVIPVRLLHQTRVLLTLVDGREVWRDSSLP
jgi:predicted amidohydrolase YtcJ